MNCNNTYESGSQGEDEIKNPDKNFVVIWPAWSSETLNKLLAPRLSRYLFHRIAINILCELQLISLEAQSHATNNSQTLSLWSRNNQLDSHREDFRIVLLLVYFCECRPQRFFSPAVSGNKVSRRVDSDESQRVIYSNHSTRGWRHKFYFVKVVPIFLCFLSIINRKISLT